MTDRILPSALVVLASLLAGLHAAEGDGAAAAQGVSGTIDGKPFTMVTAAVLPFSSDPEILQVGLFQEQVDAKMPFSQKPNVMIRIPKAGGEADLGGGKYAGTFFLPPNRNIAVQKGKVVAEKAADGGFDCRVEAATGEQHAVKGTFHLALAK